MLTLRKQVEYILDQHSVTRNSDIYLTVAIWKNFYPDKVYQNESNKDYVYLSDLLELPREDNIKRIRADIQNRQHRYLPTDRKILKQRKINEIFWHTEFSPSNPSSY